MPKSHRRPAKRQEDGLLAEIFVNLPWWAPLVSVSVVIAAIVIVSGVEKWSTSTIELFVIGALVFVGIPGLFAQVTKSQQRSLVESTKRIEDLRALKWDVFEKLVLGAYRRQGYRGDLTHAGADGGVDVILEKGGRKTYVQCKHWKVQKVGVDKVRELKGAMAMANIAHGIFVTSGVFSEDAARFARDAGIEPVDGRSLLRLLGEVRGDASAVAFPTTQPAAAPSTSHPASGDTPACPRCASPMVMRSSLRGQFWGCATFPKCRGIVNLAT